MRTHKINYIMSYVPIGSELIVTNGNLSRDQLSAFPQPISKHHGTSAPSREIPQPMNGSADSEFPIIVHCHLCWDWVWQRPQQFISRLSARHRILFVETIGPDPQLSAPSARF